MEFLDFNNHPLAIEIQKRVISIITLLDEKQYNYQSLYDGQEQLIDELLLIENTRRDIQNKIKTLNKDSSEVALNAKKSKGYISDEEKIVIKNLQIQASELEVEKNILSYGRWLFRYIGDGIAWKAYNFQRNIIRALGDKEAVPFLSNKNGIEKERLFFRGIRNLGEDWLPVMHDITNCLRTSDFSVFHAGELERLIELKIYSSKNKEGDKVEPKLDQRGKRQTERVKNIIEFMQTGDLGKLRKELEGGKFISSEYYEKHNFFAISNSIQSCRDVGYGFQEPEYGIIYLTFDTEKRFEDQALLEASKAHPHVFNSLFTFRSIIPRFEENHLSLPITAMELPSKDVIDILFGKIAVICIINYSCFESYCKDKGINLSIKKDEDGSLNISIETKNGYVRILDGIWNKILLEGFSFESFVGLTKTVLEYDIENN